MEKIIEWEVIYGLEFLKYIVAYILSTGQGIVHRKKILVLSLITSIITVLSLRKIMVTDDVYIILLGISLISLFACMKERIVERIWRVLVIMMSVTAIDGVVEYLIMKYVFNEDLDSGYLIIVRNVIIVGMIIIMFLINKYIVQRKNRYTYQSVRFAVIFAEVCLCMCATYVIEESEKSNYYFWLGILSLTGVALLGSRIFVILEMNKALKEAVNQEKLLNGMQREYYQSILRAEEETRKYRHDMNNHFMVIEGYLKKDKPDEAEKYIKSLKESCLNVSRKKYNVGNDVIDAISGYYLQLSDDFADINVNGYVPDDIGIDDINLCTIYANLLKNAVEELQRLKSEGYNNLILKIDFRVGKYFFEISVKNTAKENIDFNGINTSTSKGDKNNHGIGLSNIKRAVEKENGNITLSQADGFVHADVIIPIAK